MWPYLTREGHLLLQVGIGEARLVQRVQGVAADVAGVHERAVHLAPRQATDPSITVSACWGFHGHRSESMFQLSHLQRLASRGDEHGAHRGLCQACG